MPDLCYELLKNKTLIEGLQSEDRRTEGSVYNCLKKHLPGIFTSVLLTEKKGSPSAGEQKLIAEEAFNDAYMALIKNVRDSTFTEVAKGKETAGSLNYFMRIVWYRYQNLIEHKYYRGYFYELKETLFKYYNISADRPVLNIPDGIEIVLHTCIARLNEKCRKYMQWQLVEGKNINDIISLVTDAPGTVKKDLAICR